jgi:hypothetical protein
MTRAILGHLVVDKLGHVIALRENRGLIVNRIGQEVNRRRFDRGAAVIQVWRRWQRAGGALLAVASLARGQQSRIATPQAVPY